MLDEVNGKGIDWRAVDLNPLPEGYVSAHDFALLRAPATFLDADRTVQKGEITLLAGQPGAGKSLWAPAKAVELVLKEFTVVYLAAEGLNGDRLIAWERHLGHELPKSLIVKESIVDFTVPEAFAKFVSEINTINPDVVFIDTFAACTSSAEEDKKAAMQPVFNSLLSLLGARRTRALVLLHHLTKDGKWERGSGVLRASPANLFYLTVETNDATRKRTVRLESAKQRDAKPNDDQFYEFIEYQTRIHPDTGLMVSAPVMVKAPTPEGIIMPGRERLYMQAVYEAYKQEGVPAGVTRQDIARDTGIPYNSVGSVQQSLKGKGWIEVANSKSYITTEGIEVYENSVL